MMRKTRVLVVDDSTVIRRLVTDALSGDPTLEVVGVAANGRIALSKISQVNPDVITLDIEMPELDGLATLKEIRKTHPMLPVIMFSTLTQKGAVATIDALALGATDYVMKPANVGSVTAAIQKVRDELIPRIKTFCRWQTELAAPGPPRPASPVGRSLTGSNTPVSPHRIEIICMGISTGGPNTLAEIFKQLPADLAVPLVIVQHMPPVFTAYLADRLSSISAIKVYEAKAGTLLQPGCAWLAPGDHHLTLARNREGVITCLNQGPRENSCRPAADVLFRSVASIYGCGTLAVVMTGMGYDGLRGCEAVRSAGGRVVAQDEASSVVWGMAGAVVHAGLANDVLPLGQIAGHLTRLVNQHRTTQPLTPANG
jgi:two-component system, chemotaxis family, protein-glutamate methylesterase/glutaminase